MTPFDGSKLPFPIARVSAESKRTDEGESVRYENTIHTYSALLRFVALTLISQYLSGPQTPKDPASIRVAKMIATLRFPGFDVWYTAIFTIHEYFARKDLLEKPFLDGGPFSRPLLSAAQQLKSERLHDAIVKNHRNDHLGHVEGTSTEIRRALLAELTPLVERALDLFADALNEIMLVKRTFPGRMAIMRGPATDFPNTPIPSEKIAVLFDSASVLLLRGHDARGQDALELFPLIIADNDELRAPVLSFDGIRKVSKDVHLVRYRFFGGLSERAGEYQRFRELLDGHEVSLDLDKRNFRPWLAAEWAASETAITVGSMTGSKYFPSYYRERPRIEDRIRRWLDKGSRPGLLISADAGYGKTSLFCHLASELNPGGDTAGTLEHQDCVPLILGGDLREASLFERLCRVLGVASLRTGKSLGFQDFRELLLFWREQGTRADLHSDKRRLIVFLDAANEARDVRSVLGEVSEFARAALEANRLAGRVWVRLVVSIRTTHFLVLGRKTGLVTEGPLSDFESENLFETFESSEGKTQPWLELPEFTPEAARDVYQARAELPQASSVPWDDLSGPIRNLLRQPLLIDIFHRAFRGDNRRNLLRIVRETDLWREWFDSVLPETRGETSAFREFALVLGRECLERGETIITPDMESDLTVLPGASRDQAELMKLADLNLFERLAAVGVLRRRAEGGWDWRAQALAEYVCFRALKSGIRVDHAARRNDDG